MRYIIICILSIILFFSVMANVVFVMTLFSSQANAVESGNLLSDNFADGSWSGSNLSSRHGDNTIAGVDNQYVESQVTLSDHLLTPEINSGFTTTLDAQIWFWNNTPNQSVSSTLKIVSDDNEVTEQTITTNGTCDTWNSCSYGSMGSNTIVISDNDSLDYTITSTFSFSAPNTTGHYAADLKDPSLYVTYEEWTYDMDMEKFDNIKTDFDMKELDFTEDFTFTMYEMKEEEYKVTFDSGIDMDSNGVFFYQEESTNLDFKDKDIPMESYEDEKIDDKFEEPNSFLEETVPTEEVYEEQQFVEEEIFFDEQQDAPVEIEQQKTNSVEVVASFDDIMVAEVNRVNVMVNTQPILIDRQDFYIMEDIYTNQVNITDSRELYSNVVFTVFDPIVEHDNKVKENKERQEILMKQIRELNEIN